MHSIKDIVKQLIGKSLDAYNTKYTKVLNTRIDNIVAQAGNDNTEIVDARIDSAGVTHTTLNNRILAETKMNDEQLIEYTGGNISAEDTTQGYLKDVEILGNTIQNEEDLADIKSVGELQEDGTYKMSILSCGKNLFDDDLIYNESKFIPQTTVSVLEGKNVLIGNPNLVVWKSYDDVYLGSQKLKVKQNTSYVLSYKLKSDVNSSGFRGVAFYDSRLNFISKTETKKTRTNNWTVCTISFTTPSNCKYLGFYEWDGGSKVYIDIDTIQLEEGTQSTPYEPYQGNKCDILLPCQLEKVGTVSDRLFRREDGVWCVEKNVVTTIFDGSETFTKDSGGTLTNTDLYYTNTKRNIPATKICSVANYTWSQMTSTDSVGIYTGTSDATYIRCPINSNINNWLSQNNIIVKYLLATPQIIELPLDVQIQLNSFNGVTNIFTEDTVIEPTIKATVPKSLGASVQSLVNKTDILSDRIKAIEGLKDSQNMKYETDKGYLVCKETKNGVIDDLKLEGKTLVNLGGKVQGTYNMYGVLKRSLRILMPGSKYTFILKNNTNYDLSFYGNEKVFTNSDWVTVKANSILTKIYTTLSTDITEDILIKSASNNSTVFDLDVVVLEGDHTQNPPSYFEGLMSVGQDVDKIEVLSIKSDGNLVEYIELNGVIVANGKDYTDNKYVRTNYITVEPNQTYYIKPPTNVLYKGCTVYFYDSNKSYLGHKSGLTSEFTTVANTKFIRIDMKKADDTSNTQGDINNCDFVVSKYRVSEYIPYQSDKKQILFYNENGELEPVQELHEWDSIEKHSDNKWYYHKRSGKVVLNGSENWNGFSSIEGVGKAYTFSVANKKNGFDNLVCDKLPTIKSYASESHILNGISGTPDNSAIWVSINNSITDIERFKQWLQANNVTVVYQLAEEEVYELAPLHLDSYANETLILCNSGAISPKMEFSITSHINELVKAYGERINLLEEKVYKYMVTQNRMQLASTYSADSVTFKVDYFSLCGDEENYDEDLYNLILNNILVGKDNYNYDKMFTMILDYASWNQISWEQFDILVGLMDMQHNPPVEELPPEDVIEEDIIENETPVE